MKRINRQGPALLPGAWAPKALDAADVRALVNRHDVAVLDTRGRDVFRAGHLRGAILADLDFQFCTIAGSYVADGQAVCLVVDEARLDEAVRALVRIGIDRIEGYITPAVLHAFAASGGSLVVAVAIAFEEAERRRARGQGRLLDVRGRAEYDRDHLPEALNIAHTRVLERLGDLPSDTPWLVHCATGGRAAAVASVLERLGYRAVAVDGVFADYCSRVPAGARSA